MSRIITSAVMAIALTGTIGCGTNTQPNEGATVESPKTAKWTTARIHIDGFKKSKSGAT